MALEQRYKTDEVSIKDTKMVGNCDSDGEKCKYSSKIPPWIWLLPQYVKRSGGGGGREGGVENQTRLRGLRSSFSSAGAA